MTWRQKVWTDLPEALRLIQAPKRGVSQPPRNPSQGDMTPSPNRYTSTVLKESFKNIVPFTSYYVTFPVFCLHNIDPGMHM